MFNMISNVLLPRLEKQILEIELTYQEQRTRLVAEMRAENERVARELADRERAQRDELGEGLCSSTMKSCYNTIFDFVQWREYVLILKEISVTDVTGLALDILSFSSSIIVLQTSNDS